MQEFRRMMRAPDLTKRGLTPRQDALRRAFVSRVGGMQPPGPGRVVFLEASRESGATTLLGAVAAELDSAGPRSVVVSGRFAGGEFRSDRTAAQHPDPEDLTRLWDATLSLGSSLFPAVGPIIRDILEVSSAATSVTKRMLAESRQSGVDDLLLRVMRTVAADRRIVCLIDDADEAPSEWWLALMTTWAQEIATEISVTLIVSYEADQDVTVSAHSNAQSASRVLVERHLAEIWSLSAMPMPELENWFGRMKPPLGRTMQDVSGGFPGAACELWDAWLHRGDVTCRDDVWIWTGDTWPPPEAGDVLAHQLADVLAGQSLSTAERSRLILSTAALEGRSFTADVVARALNLDRDAVIDLLDDVLSVSPSGSRPLVAEVPATIAHLNDGRQRRLWRYRFARQLDWYAAKMRLTTPDERAERAGFVAIALIELYELPDARVAATVSALWRLAGNAQNAAEYQRIANFGLQRSVIRSQAESLMTLQTAPPRWAAQQLIHACHVLLDSDGPRRPLDYSRRAEQLSRLAADSGLVTDALIYQAEALLRMSEYDAAESALAPLTANLGAGTDRALDLGRIMGEILLRKNQYEASRRWLAPALKAAVAASDPASEGAIRCILTRLERRDNNVHAARGHAARWLECERIVDDLEGQGNALYELAMIDWYEEDFVRARQGLEHALRVAREASASVSEGIVRSALGRLAIQDGEVNRADAQLSRALEIHLEVGDERFEGATRYGLAQVHAAKGQVSEAAAELNSAIPKLERAGDLSLAQDARALRSQLQARGMR